VSVHDVSPRTRKATETILKDLAEEGVPFTSLLVIPDHHHGGTIGSEPEFGDWLRGAVERGHEAVLHGYHHVRAAKKGDGLITRLVTGSYTAGEGEFFDLSREEARDLLRLGREAFDQCRIEGKGFIAPAWLLSGEAEGAVREEGFDYTTRIGSVLDLRSGVSFSARSLVYSVRSRWRRSLSLAWNEMLFHILRGAPLLRIGLHPPDWRHDRIRHHALKCIRAAALTRRVTTYRGWLDRVRSSASGFPQHRQDAGDSSVFLGAGMNSYR